MGEGFGDYLAAAMSALITGGNATFDACIFDWDGDLLLDQRLRPPRRHSLIR